MTEEEIKKQIEIQRNYFYTGATLPVKSRIEVLKKLKEYIVEHEKEMPSMKTLAKALLRAICAKRDSS